MIDTLLTWSVVLGVAVAMWAVVILFVVLFIIGEVGDPDAEWDRWEDDDDRQLWWYLRDEERGPS